MRLDSVDISTCRKVHARALKEAQDCSSSTFDFLMSDPSQFPSSGRLYSRPIVWVASFSNRCVTSRAIGPSSYHQKALIICRLESKSHLRDVLVSTHGVLFFGTPHSGTNGVALLQIMNRLLSVYMKTTDNVLQHLKANSSELENIQSMYLSASEGLNAVCFYEEYPTPIVGGRQELARTIHSQTLES